MYDNYYEDVYTDDIVLESLANLSLEYDSYLMESSTIELLKAYFSSEKAEIVKLVHDARKSIKAKQYKDAMVRLKSAQKKISAFKEKINKIDNNAGENIIANIIFVAIDSLTTQIMSVILTVDRICQTRSIRSAFTGFTERDYTETLPQRLFQNAPKQYCLGTINFLINSIDKTIVSLDKIMKDEEKVKKEVSKL